MKGGRGCVISFLGMGTFGGFCQRCSHSRKTCDYHESLVECDGQAHAVVQAVFQDAIGRIKGLESVQWKILVHDVQVRLYHKMGLNGPKTTISHINCSCKNREFMLKPR